MNQIALPLHPSQYEVYVDQLLNTESPHYNIGLYIKLKGSLNKEMFRETIRSSSDVFDAFKMRFDFSQSEPLCYFDESYEGAEIAEMDLSDKNNPENEAISWMQNQFNTPFSIQKDKLLFEFALIKVSPDENWFFFRYHHLIIDGYGFNLWVNYVARKYRSLLEGQNLEVDYPSYKDEIIRASNYRSSFDYEIDEAYWKDKIGEKSEALLKRSINSAIKPTKKGGKYYVTISNDQRDAFNEVLLATKSNLHRLTIAALLIYFGNISEQPEIIFGLPVHKRGIGDLRRIVGMFSGILPFRSVFKNDINLTELLKEITSSIKNSYSHQNYLIVDLIRSLKIKPSEGFLYDVIVNYIPYRFELDFGQELQPTPVGIQSEYQNFPLQITWRDYGDQQPLELALHYSYEYFTPEAIALFAKRVLFILDQFPSALDTNIGSIDILPWEERQLLDKFNATAVAYPKGQSIVTLFEQQVESTPDAVALVFEEQRLSYRELDERANQLGHYLRSKGVEEEILVPICINRSVEMIVGILGILKAGGAYVPLDPEYPQERISYMLRDTRAALVVCNKEGRSKLPISGDWDIVDIDTDWDNISQYGKHQVSTSLGAQHLAYIIYTSGSTGTPKGVMIEHGSLVASTQARQSYYESLGAVFLVLSFAFDSSVAVIFGTLLMGGSIILCENKLIKDVGYIRQLLTEVDTILCTTSYYRLLLEEGIIENSSLSKVIVGGENLDEQIISQHFIRTKNVSLYNEYGPTEYTVWATVAKIESIDSRVGIGRPIANTSLYIVGRKNSLNPIGVAGEICLAGDSLARGYLNNEEMSKQKFVSNPFSTKPGARMYKTGDVGRFLPNGNVEFIGRMDNQVKILGHRIELGEVESVLQQCEQVRQAVVLVQKDIQGGKRLVGYVVPYEAGFDREALRQYLSNKLPQHMIPSLWVELKELPLTANGKINRNSLPEAGTSETTSVPYEAPRNEVEARLSAVWQEVLKVEKVGVHDNFFELGGDSIRTIQVVSRAKRLGYSLQAKDLFLYQTIEKLSQVIIIQSEGTTGNEHFQGQGKEAVIPANNTKSLIPARTGGSKIPLYIVCGGGGTVFAFKKFIDILDVDQPVYVLQQPTDLKDLSDFPVDIKGIAARYIEEILTQNPSGPYALSGHCIGGIIALEMAKQLEATDKEVALLAMFDTIAQEDEKLEVETFSSLYNRPSIIKNFFSKLYLKIHFEAFLLKNHTKHAIEYKVTGIKSLFSKFLSIESNRKEDVDYKFFAGLGDSFALAYRNYQLMPDNREIIVFYAKDHYYFLDKNRNITYRKFDLSDNVKERWKSYVGSATFYEIEGEHATMFDPEFGGKELAHKLQEHLNSRN